MTSYSILRFSLGLSLLFSCSQLSATQKEAERKHSTQLKVAAFNVRAGANATAKEIGEALRPYDLDIVCFSEAPGGDWTKKAAEVLGLDHFVVGLHSTAGHADKFKAIASRTSLYGQQEIQMGDTLHTVTRALTKLGDKEIAIYAVHFPKGWRNQAHIDETTEKIAAFIDYLGKRPAGELALIMGDFNFVPSRPDRTSMYHEMFTKIGFDVCWNDLGTDLTGRNTSRVFKPEIERRGHVIDHIMYEADKVRALRGEIIEVDKPLSDHKPVWALLELK